MEDKLSNIPSEMALLGCLFINPDLHNDVGLNLKYDISDDKLRFLYTEVEIFYHKHASVNSRLEISEQKFNLHMSGNEEKLKTYKELGGWKLIERIKNNCNEEDFKVYSNDVKKMSLIRQLYHKGFNVKPVIEHKSFDKMTPQDVMSAFHFNLAKVYLNVTNNKDVVLLGQELKEQIDLYRESPKFGYNLPFKIMTDAMLGVSKKQFIAFASLSNLGKSRIMLNMMAYMSIIEGARVGILLNEMSSEEINLALLTTICNEEVYGFSLGIDEKRLALGDYKNEEEYQKVCEVIEYIKEKCNIFVIELCDINDATLEREIKKLKNVYKIDCAFYDTMKNFADGWETLVRTSILLKSLANQLEIAVCANLQLTDETINVKPDEMSSLNISTAKMVKHNLDMLWLFKDIKKSEYSKYRIYNPDWGYVELDRNKRYYAYVNDKNRRNSKPKLCFEIELNQNIIKECGYLVRENMEVD